MVWSGPREVCWRGLVRTEGGLLAWFGQDRGRSAGVVWSGLREVCWRGLVRTEGGLLAWFRQE